MKYYSYKNFIYYPNSHIPINKLDIMDVEEIEELENQLFLKTYEYFHENLSLNTIFNKKYLKDIHKYAFSNLYAWAGKYRNINISKENTVFCQAIHLMTQSDIIFDKLNNDNYLKDFQDKSSEEFANKIAYYMCELIALHPFFELNGRTIRLFFDMISVYNGYDYINYGDISSRKDNAFIKASKNCMINDCTLMEKIILNGLKKSNN